jgi:hypothetical protein
LAAPSLWIEMVDPLTEAMMREDLQHDDAIELGAATQVTQGVEEPEAEEDLSIPDFRD